MLGEAEEGIRCNRLSGRMPKVTSGKQPEPGWTVVLANGSWALHLLVLWSSRSGGRGLAAADSFLV